MLALIGYLAINGFVNKNTNQVTVDGQSSIKVTPDLVTVYFNVETNGSTAVDAKDANSAIVNKLTYELIALGFDREDIQTEGFNIYEDIRWENDKQKSYGFKATHQIKVEMNTSSASKISEVIDAGVDAGALLQYINFELTTQKQNEYKAQALREASLDAKTKAEAVASGLGKRVGKIISISTSNYDYRPWPIYYSANGGVASDVAEAKVAVNNIQPGSQEVSAYVSATYRIV